MLPAVVEGDIANLAGGDRSVCGHGSGGPGRARLHQIGADRLRCGGPAARLPGAAWPCDGRRIELRDLNHLVAALLRLLNYGDCARLYAHKY